MRGKMCAAKKTLLAGVAAAGILAISALPAAATAITANTGWFSDSVSADNTPSANSPYTFTLTSEGALSLTDAFVEGDIYTISDSFTSVVLDTSSFTLLPTYWIPGATTPDSAWANAGYSHGQLLLGPGSYSLNVEDISDAGLPAGFYARLDTVPEPSTLTLLGAAMLLLGFVGFKRFKNGVS